jgi:hypothetical protein
MNRRGALLGGTLGVVLCTVLGTVLGACRSDLPATEIVVTVDTTFGVPCTIDALHIEATGDGDPVATDFAVGDADLPGSITLVPSGAPHQVTVSVTALRDGAVFATATGTASFEHESSLELRFVLDRSCVPGPCQAVGVGGFRTLPDRRPRRGCGEHGYSWKNASLVMRDACAMPEASTGTVLRDVDEAEAVSPLLPSMPFPFRFYGAPVTRVWAGTNGYLGFGDTMPDALNGSVGASRSLGEPGFPGRGVLAFWDDLRTGASGVCFTVSGEFPDRMLWITWKEACFASPGQSCRAAPELGTLTFGVALEETTDRIYLGYRTMVATGNPDRAKAQTATIGVTNAVPRGCIASACSVDGTCQDGRPCGYTEFPARRIVEPLPTLEFDPR